MSWLCSRALVEEFSAATCSDGARSALSSGSPTPRAFLPSDRTTAFSRLSRFGMTFGPLTDDLGAELLTWFREASRARTSALPARGLGSTAPGRGCGPTWRGSLARFDPASSLWRTAQPSLLGDSDECSVTWPRSGMTAGGQCWERPMSARLTSETASGLWPTPTANNFECKDLGAMLERRERAKEKARNGNGFGLTLGNAVRLVATPTARDLRSGKASQATMERNSRPLSEQIGGSLNPTWVEWLMGWPLGWTDLKPLATGKSPCVPKPLGELSPQILCEEAA